MNNHDSSRRAGYRSRGFLWCWALVLALASFQVEAFQSPFYTGGPGGGTLFPGPFNSPVLNRVFAADGVAGDVLVKDPIRVGIGNASADMAVARGFAFGDALALGARALPYVGTAALLYTVYDQLGCHWTGGTMQCDLGVAPTLTPGYRYTLYSNPGAYWGDTPQDVIVHWLGPSQTLVRYSCGTIVQGGSAGCSVTRIINGVQSDTAVSVALLQTNVKQCPNNLSVRLDGKCNGGTVQGVTPEEAAQFAKPYVNPSIAPAVVKQAIESGVDATPYAQPKTATGPATVTQPSTTTTKTDANGVTQVSTTTVTNNITYQGDTYNITNSTVTTNPDGSQTKTNDAPQKSQCELSPDSAGCAKLGDPGEGTLPTDTKNISFTPVDFAAVAGCPAPVSFSAMGHSYTFSYDAMCDTIGSWVRGLVLAIGSFIAAYVFIQGLKA